MARASVRGMGVNVWFECKDGIFLAYSIRYTTISKSTSCISFCDTVY